MLGHVSDGKLVVRVGSGVGFGVVGVAVGSGLVVAALGEGEELRPVVWVDGLPPACAGES